MNLIIQSLIFASFVYEIGLGLFSPVFAIFIAEQIIGGSIALAGYAEGVYWIVKSIIQIPIGKFLDEKKGEIDDFWALFAGHVLMGAVAFLYAYVETPAQLISLQAILAVGGALSVPSWYGMFIRHADRAREGFEWSINSSFSFGLGAGGAAFIGGYLAGVYGFPFVFKAGAIFIWLSSLVLLALRRHLKNHEKPPIPRLPYRL